MLRAREKDGGGAHALRRRAQQEVRAEHLVAHLRAQEVGARLRRLHVRPGRGDIVLTREAIEDRNGEAKRDGVARTLKGADIREGAAPARGERERGQRRRTRHAHLGFRSQNVGARRREIGTTRDRAGDECVDARGDDADGRRIAVERRWSRRRRSDLIRGIGAQTHRRRERTAPGLHAARVCLEVQLCLREHRLRLQHVGDRRHANSVALLRGVDALLRLGDGDALCVRQRPRLHVGEVRALRLQCRRLERGVVREVERDGVGTRRGGRATPAAEVEEEIRQRDGRRDL